LNLSVLCFGEIVSDLIDGGNGGLVCKVGGAPLNVAVALKRLGERCALVSSVGGDWFGANAVSYLKSNGIKHFVETIPATATRTAVISHDRKKERAFQFSPGIAAENALSARQIESVKSPRFGVLYFGSFPFARGKSLSAFKRFVCRARKSGIYTVFDPNIRLSVFDSADSARAICKELAAISDVVRLNVDEILLLTGVAASSGRRMAAIEKAASVLTVMGPRVAFITDGGNGSYMYHDGRCEHQEPFQVRAVDTTGCGDAFTAAVIAKYFNKGRLGFAQPTEILRWANAAGALAATRLGGADSMPTKIQIENFIESRSRGGDKGKKKVLSTEMSTRFKSKGRIT